MLKILFINHEPAYLASLKAVVEPLSGQIEEVSSWTEARDLLFKTHFDLVCLNYDSCKIEGLDSFILLDNILQKEATPGLVLLQSHSPRAHQFVGSLESLKCIVELAPGTQELDELREAIEPLLAASLAASLGAQGSSVASEAIELSVRLPNTQSGQLDQVSLSRLLYAVYRLELSGAMELSMDAVKRNYLFEKGKLLEVANSEFSDAAGLCSAFAWGRGTFGLHDENNKRTGSPVELITLLQRGIEHHVPQRHVMDDLMPLMKLYPVTTNLWHTQSRVPWPVLERLIGKCDGQHTLEAVLGKMGAEVTAGFRAALFAKDTDLIFLRPDPTERRVLISYGPGVTTTSQSEEVKQTKAYRAAGAERDRLEFELKAFKKKIAGESLHEVFGVWEGCGRQAVKERFYVLVKEHHPDVYGGNVSEGVKRLAQSIFITIKETYAELMKIEREQTVARPEPTKQSTKAGVDDSKAAPDPRGFGEQKRDKMKTLLSQGLSSEAKSSSKPGMAPTRQRRSNTPIGLSREPSDAHPEALRDVNSEARQQKLDQLNKKVARHQTPAPVSGPSGPRPPTRPAGQQTNPGMKIPLSPKENFNQGYKLFRNQLYTEAFPFFEQAHQVEPANGLFLTFYAYTLFQVDIDRRDECEGLLRKAIELGNRQATPDAHLFLGYLLKVKDAHDEAFKHFKTALTLNPSSVEAKREIRLHQKRYGDASSSDPVGFLKNLFKK